MKKAVAAKVAKIGKDKPAATPAGGSHKVKKIVTQTVHFGDNKPAAKKAAAKKK
jgi:hypothetical protein